MSISKVKYTLEFILIQSQSIFFVFFNQNIKRSIPFELFLKEHKEVIKNENLEKIISKCLNEGILTINI